MNIKVKNVAKFFELHIDDEVFWLNEQQLRRLRNETNAALTKLGERRKRHARSHHQANTG